MDMDTTPALKPPDGIESNFVDPPTLMPAVIGTSATVLVLSTSFVALRAFVKLRVWRGHNPEDWLSYAAWAGLASYTGLLVYIEDYGFARHQWDVSVAQFQHILYTINVLYCIYPATTLAAKLSVLFQIKRIFTTAARDVVYWVVTVSIGANVVFYTGLFFSYVFQCWPRAAIWDSDVHGTCISATSSNLAAGILNLISDLEALLLPAWAIWHLSMPIKRKLAAYAVFGIGSIACIIGIVGIYLRVLVLRYSDFTWLCSKAALLVISEIAVVIIVGCTPTLPSLYHYIRRNSQAAVSSKTSGPRPYRDPHSPYNSSQSRGSGASGATKKKLNPRHNPLAKYMVRGGTVGITTLGSRLGGDEEEYELRRHAADGFHRDSVGADNRSDGAIWKGTSQSESNGRDTPPRRDSGTEG
ncbi:hypothetical protein F4775DRAFT_139899 [Biscogniauxia sp. FL1348]|nr:hypothetical protein F4775DRAFT_139899 [Biscogniauxia sp. FL1348]